MSSRARAIIGSLLGTAVGDSIGLPYEGLSARRARLLLGPPDRHRLLFRHGMISDDTEHAVIAAQSLAACSGDVDEFGKQLARRMRRWFLGLPAGIGLATLRAMIRLCVGFGAERAGVFSAGNGPAMRAPILGAAVADEAVLARSVRVSTRITHRDPKAYYGALAVALAARQAASCEAGGNDAAEAYLASVETRFGLESEFPDDDTLPGVLRAAVDSASRGEDTREFVAAARLEKKPRTGVSGYIYHTVPACIHAWLRHPRDLPRAVREVVDCGGDADTTAAITGGIVGASTGIDGIPLALRRGIIDWPFDAARLERLGAHLARSLEIGGERSPLERFPVLLRWPRNVLFAAVVIGHGLRRLLPPY